MTKQTLSAAVLSIAATLIVTSSAHAGPLYASASTAEYQSSVGYDFSGPGNLPPVTYQNIGTFTFSPIAVGSVSLITISGTFGNLDYGQTTALSDYYLGDLADGEEAVKVAGCDSSSANCYSGQNGPYVWSFTLDAAQIADLGKGLQAGSIDFGYTWDQGTLPVPDPFFGDSNGYDLQYIDAGPATLSVFTPEPAAVLCCFTGIAAIVVLRRFRKAGTNPIYRRDSTMKKIELALCVSAALFAPVLVGTSAAQSASWTAASTPIQATITNGPWNLSQGGTATAGGAYNGPVPYCTPGNSGGGTPLINGVNGPSTTNIMNPYYFPFVVGSGQTVKGYFDYRPKNINEAVVVATSTNAGQSWTFQGIAEQLTSGCPNSNSNTANDTPGGNPAGNDDGEGHPSIISYGSSTLLYTLNRSAPHVDSDGLIVHQLKPQPANPLNPLPANSPLMQPPGCASPSTCTTPLAPAANIIAGWNFNNDSNTSTTYTTITGNPSFKVNNSPAPSTNNVEGSNTPTASALGMANGYTYSTAAVSIPKNDGGTGYAVNDTGTIGGSTVLYTVSAVSAGGIVTAVTVPQFGSGLGLSVGTTYTTSATTGSGTNLMLKVTGTTTVGSVNGDDVTATTLSSDPSIVLANNSLANVNVAPNDNNAWRIRGPGVPSSGAGDVVGTANTGNGWNLAAPPCTQGAQFMVDTTNYHYVVLQFDWYTTNQGVRDLQVLYTTNGGTTWTPVGPIQVSGGGSAFNNQITINFKALGITSVENIPNFGVRMVSVYDPDYQGGVGYSAPGGNVCSSSATGTYTAASLDGTTNQPDVYNNNSGNWRFDEVNILGTLNNTNPITSDPIINTTGLVNPDGFLAVVPNTYPIEVLYISKTLNSDYVPPTNYPACPPSIPNGNLNDDVEVVRIATTTNFVNFTDTTPTNPVPSSTTSQTMQMVAGLSDPATTSYSGIRWISGNGTLIQLSNGNWGLFFGGGNCLDGDSDAFHAIMYAESKGNDLTKWTVINGINNPIASIASVTGTDPVTGMSVTIPANTPLVGQSVGGGQFDWFSGRVYAPNAIVTSPNTVSLVFSGYNAGFQLGGSSRDYSNYRNVGQVNLSVSNVTLQ